MGDITQTKLLEAFNYNKETGELSHKHDSSNGLSGEIATSFQSGGYLTVRINSIDYLAHRIIFFMVIGKWPIQIDHINHARDDNRWVNMREVTNRENHLNESIQSNTSTGITGVSLHKPTGKYRAYIMVNLKHIHLGLFDTVQQAAEARLAANIQYGFHKNHGKVGCANDTI